MQNSLYTIMHTRGIKSEILFYKAAETQLPTNQYVFGETCSTVSWAIHSNRMQQLRFARKTPQMTFSKPAGKMDTNLAFILKVICLKIQDSFFFCISGILHSKKISAYRLGNKTLFPLCCKVIKDLFVPVLCGSLKKENFHFPYNGSCAFRNYKYP